SLAACEMSKQDASRLGNRRGVVHFQNSADHNRGCALGRINLRVTRNLDALGAARRGVPVPVWSHQCKVQASRRNAADFHEARAHLIDGNWDVSFVSLRKSLRELNADFMI